MAYGDRRQPWHPSARRTYSRPAPGQRTYGVGQVADVVAMASSGANAIIRAFGASVDGTQSDPRVQLLNNAYQQARAGNNQSTPYPGTGIYYLQNWINDQPPHPAYSRTLAQQLLNSLQSPGGAAAAAANPVVQAAGIAPAIGIGPVGVASGPSLFTLILLAAGGYLVVKAAR